MPADILIVDDNPNNLFALENLLAAPDLNIITAGSGNEALAKTLSHEFAIALLDVQMPEMDGFETAELMRGNSRTRHIPIIFVTANRSEREYVFRGYDSGAVDYLAKPLDVNILKSKVNVFLELHRQRRALEEKTRELDAKISEMERLQNLLQERNEQLRVLSRTDRLTGIFNRLSFDETLDYEWRRCDRGGKPLTLIMADIDHFKAYNDRLGHIAGDHCLKQVAWALSAALMRHVDTIARYGGEEFAAILPETDESGAVAVVTRMRNAVKALNIAHPASPTELHVTISLGVASMLPDPNLSPLRLIEMADDAMYRAKALGRDRHALYSQLG
ncbi:diguanylate cyclase [Oleispirillum naphthae]|uniref:diguanylate cyclase n=1 Tax=Oleispirillum naphthae TaxID=2838853 RepID=UPI003082396F